MHTTRTDRVIAAIEEELEDQRPGIDAGAPLTSVTVFVDLHPDGNVRRVKFRADRERDGRGAQRRLRARRLAEDNGSTV